ncbi:hypothetical protein ACK3TF_001789 [Chlorella vulgaris]
MCSFNSTRIDKPGSLTDNCGFTPAANQKCHWQFDSEVGQTADLFGEDACCRHCSKQGLTKWNYEEGFCWCSRQASTRQVSNNDFLQSCGTASPTATAKTPPASTPETAPASKTPPPATSSA